MAGVFRFYCHTHSNNGCLQLKKYVKKKYLPSLLSYRQGWTALLTHKIKFMKTTLSLSS